MRATDMSLSPLTEGGGGVKQRHRPHRAQQGCYFSTLLRFALGLTDRCAQIVLGAQRVETVGALLEVSVELLGGELVFALAEVDDAAGQEGRVGCVDLSELVELLQTVLIGVGLSGERRGGGGFGVREGGGHRDGVAEEEAVKESLFVEAGVERSGG